MTIGSHQTTVGKNNSRFTPQKIWRPLGPFPTDAATGLVRPWDIGTERNVTIEDNCLTMDWRAFGFTWFNPPFMRYLIAQFVLKMCKHTNGIMLLHVRSDAQWWRPAAEAAMARLDIAGRIIFHNEDGSLATVDDPESKHFGKVANSGAPVTLFGFGQEGAARLASVVARAEYDGRNLIWPEGQIPGDLLILRFPRSIMAMFVGSWRELIIATFGDREFAVSELYILTSHPKARCNRNPREKLRQTVRRNGFERVGPATYRRANA